MNEGVVGVVEIDSIRSVYSFFFGSRQQSTHTFHSKNIPSHPSSNHPPPPPPPNTHTQTQQQGQSSCIRSQFLPPYGNSQLHGRSYSFDLVMAAGVCAVIAAVASALARRSLSSLAEEEQRARGGGVVGGQRLGGAAILDLNEPLVGQPVVVVDPSAPPPVAAGRV
jgi:hypothetical protein